MAEIHIHLPMSAGTHPNPDAPAARSGLAGIRRTAARNVYSLAASDGNKEINQPGPAARANVVTPNKGAVKSPPGRNSPPPEKIAPFTKEPIGRANEQARQLHRKGR